MSVQTDTKVIETAMSTKRPTEQTILEVQGDLDRLGATCRVRAKQEPRGKWAKIADGVATFETALALVPELLETTVEVGFFLDHEKYGGILIWTSNWPEGANRFNDYPEDPARE